MGYSKWSEGSVVNNSHNPFVFLITSSFLKYGTQKKVHFILVLFCCRLKIIEPHNLISMYDYKAAAPGRGGTSWARHPGQSLTHKECSENYHALVRTNCQTSVNVNVMVNFMCSLGWVIGSPDIWSNIILYIFG